ncbi:hypothetical protein BP5796_12788 [Coleophoma crateriformis]|uniref:DUF7703 domain-containing protein n=1 Tax=Coleophoma crateriformis TaxID=565419 RepID=A0A3D8Q6R7_9HELO|nr:hypothetical protein BP5796_12788 [Coleophoma crateriformis]
MQPWTSSKDNIMPPRSVPASYENTTITAFGSSGRGVTGGYNGISQGWEITISALCALAAYNAAEIIILTFVTFKRYRGAYFLSLLVAALGVILNALGYFIKYMGFAKSDAQKYGGLAIVVIGWSAMVTGHSLVLWSRLGLFDGNSTASKLLLRAIIINGIVLHPTTTVFVFGANMAKGDIQEKFVRGYVIMEKIQLTIFFLQELVLLGDYVYQALRMLRYSSKKETRRLLTQLFAMSIIIILLDCIVISFEYANFYLLQVATKAVVYSIKLKLEFAVLSRLVEFISRPRQVSGTLDLSKAIASHSISVENQPNTPQRALKLADPSIYIQE